MTTLAAAGDSVDTIAKWFCVGFVVLIVLVALYAVVALVVTHIRLPKTVVYDKVKWYGDILNRVGDRAYVPGGLFLAWMIESNLLNEDFCADAEVELEIAQIKNRTLTGPALYQRWDGVLTDEMFDDVGNLFAKEYVGVVLSGSYLGDLQRTLCSPASTSADDVFSLADTWENYELLKPLLDSRFQAWSKTIVMGEDA
ncbi:MAG: hypothetical protein K8T25_13825 [Planctomycetia bacterium]|nr:hypothetical protein [Planctomycetia bacterium]